nr:MAG TPA: hypothetical protein [Caudoviricetes sp.]
MLIIDPFYFLIIVKNGVLLKLIFLIKIFYLNIALEITIFGTHFGTQK